MRLFFLSLLLLGSLWAIEVLDVTDKIKVYDERIPNTEYDIYNNQTLTLTYEAYPGVFATHLRKKSYDESKKVYEEEEFELFQEDAAKNLAENGCVAFQRELDVGATLSIDVPFDNDDSLFFTDLVPCSDHNKVFIVRNDLTLFEIIMETSADRSHIKSIMQPGNYSSFMNYLGSEAEKAGIEYNNPFMIQDHESMRIFILTQYGGVSFDPRRTLDANFTFQKEEFFPRTTIYDIHYDPKHLVFFVAVGLQGIDIYDVIDGHVKFRINLVAALFGLKDWNIIDVDLSETNDVLYVLDNSRGLMFIEIGRLTENVYLKMPFEIPVNRAIAFDHYKQTFFLIAEAYNQEYAVEIFVNFRDQTYYFNRYYDDEMQLNDVVLFPDYAILVGYDAHKLIYHSLYTGFIDLQLEHHTIFSEPELVKIVHYQWDLQNPNHYQLAGLGHSQFKTFKIQQTHPRIMCHSTDPLKQVYLLSMNSTNCNSKSAYQDHSQYSSCKIHHAFTFQVQQVFASTGQKVLFIILIVLFVALFCGLGLSLILCWRKWGQHITNLEAQSYELKQRERYGHLQEQNANQEEQTVNQEPQP